MRVIGGTYRAKKLCSPEGDAVRPTADRVREALFNILQFRLPGCVFLDLFAGSGAIGIEALSRGAQTVFFFDADTRTARKNLIGIAGDARVEQCDYLAALKRLFQTGEKFDVVYIDPPYREDYGIKAVEKIAEYGLLGSDGVIIVESDLKFCHEFKPPIRMSDQRKYGGTYLNFFNIGG